MPSRVLQTPVTPTERIMEILLRCPLFQTTPSLDLERLAARSRYQQYRRGAEIVAFGQDGSFMAVIGRGRVKALLSAPDGGLDLIVGLLWPGDTFGEMSVFDHQPRPGAVFAVTETDLVLVPRLELLALLERRPAVALRVMEGLCAKLRTAMQFGVSIRFFDIPSRLFQRLQYLCAKDGRKQSDGSVRIQHALSQEDLASSIGASREALNKLLSEWKKAGEIETGRGYVVVRDFEALRRLLPVATRPHALTAKTETPPSPSSLRLVH